MRIDLYHKTPHYQVDFDVAMLVDSVIFNGKKIKSCLLADEETGVVVCSVSDSDGNVVVDGDNVRFVTMSGNVKIQFKENLPDYMLKILAQ